MATILITVEQLRKICTILSAQRAVLVADAINKVCPQYGINTDIASEFLATVAHESVEFTRYEENLNYSAQRIYQVWPGRFKTLAEALPYAHNPQKLACKVYGERLGNVDFMDGWDFRGSGPIQMTGKSNFIAFANWMGRSFGIWKQEKEWASLVRTNDEMGMHSACWIFSVAKDLNDEAENDDMRRIIKRINGGFIGEASRMKYYELCKRIL